ncbi:MAG: PAS domain-containing protein [Roseovarius indicus]
MSDETDTSDDVIELSASRPGDGRDARKLLAYWSGLQDGRTVPKRADIDPRRIEGLLSDTFILERIAPGLARFRVAGANLAELMGMDVRGMPVSSFINPEGREAFAGALARLFEEPATVQLDLVSASGFGQPKLTGRMLLLPLRSDLGDVSRAIGCLVADGRPGRVPRRFDVARMRVAPVDGGPVEVRRPEPAPRPVPVKRGPPHLRLVTSN